METAIMSTTKALRADPEKTLPADTKEIRPITVTVNTTKRLSNLGHTKLYDLIRQGKLKTVKVGRRTLLSMIR